MYDIQLEEEGVTMIDGVTTTEYKASYRGESDYVYEDAGHWYYSRNRHQPDSMHYLPTEVYCSDAAFNAALDRLELALGTKGEQDGLFDDSNKHTNEAGGTQTHLPMRADLIPSDVLIDVAVVLAEGAEKYGKGNWKLISNEDHINHALVHIYRYQMGDAAEPHLVHALCRLLFASHIDNNPRRD